MGRVQVSKAAEDSEQLRHFMKDPSIPRGPKQAALDAILAKLGVNDLTKNFFGAFYELLGAQASSARFSEQVHETFIRYLQAC